MVRRILAALLLPLALAACSAPELNPGEFKLTCSDKVCPVGWSCSAEGRCVPDGETPQEPAGEGEGEGEPQPAGEGEGEGEPPLAGEGEGEPPSVGEGEGEALPAGEGEGEPPRAGEGEGEGEGEPPGPVLLGQWILDGDASHQGPGALGGIELGTTGYAPGFSGEAARVLSWGDGIQLVDAGAAFGLGDAARTVWLRYRALPAARFQATTAVSVRDRNGGGWSLGRDLDGQLVIRGAADPVVLGAAPEIGRWAEVAVAYGDGGAAYFLDGQLMGAGLFQADAQAERASTDAFLGADGPQGAEPLRGLLDEVRLYEGLLTSAELLALGSLDDCDSGGPDADADRTPDHCEDDADGDGVSDDDELACGSDPLDEASRPKDSDQDETCDGRDDCPVPGQTEAECDLPLRYAHLRFDGDLTNSAGGPGGVDLGPGAFEPGDRLGFRPGGGIDLSGVVDRFHGAMDDGTIHMRLRIEPDAPAGGYLIQRGGGGPAGVSSNQWRLRDTASGLQLLTQVEANISHARVFGFALPRGRWFDLTLTTEAGTATAYLDGVHRRRLGYTPSDAVGEGLWIAADAAGDNVFDGLIDDVMLFEEALSPAQVAAVAGREQPARTGALLDLSFDGSLDDDSRFAHATQAVAARYAPGLGAGQQALAVTGEDEVVVVPAPFAPRLAESLQEFTIFARYSMDAGAVPGALFGLFDAPDAEAGLEIQAGGGRATLTTRLDAATDMVDVDPIDDAGGAWIELAFVVADGQVRPYVNGVPGEAVEYLLPEGFRPDVATVGGLFAGGVAGSACDCRIDRLAVWDKALTEAELVAEGIIDDRICGGQLCCVEGCPAHPLEWVATCNAQAHCEYAGEERPFAEEIWVPPGRFDMGAPAAEGPGEATEGPVHEVRFEQGFFFGKYEVSVQRFRHCIGWEACAGVFSCQGGVNPAVSNISAGNELHPINCMPQAQAEAYCTFIEGRLPTEAEWEYAATGPIHRKHPWGDEPPADCDHAILQGCLQGNQGGQRVDSKPLGVSAIGAYQMVGNMHEWVADCGHASYDDDPPVDGSAWGDSCVDGGLWTLRGPSWVTPLGAGRSAWRQLANPGQTFAHQGIRCARDPLEPE